MMATPNSSGDGVESGEELSTQMVALELGNATSTRVSGDGGDVLESAERESLLNKGWRRPNCTPSLPEVNSSVQWPAPESPWYKKVFALMGLGFMISVAYMDPGNWAVDLDGGASYGYTLLIVILLSNMCAIFLQFLSLKLGVVAERDLAQACRDAYPKWVVYILWIIVEIAIAATDLAEVIGSATALYLLFRIPFWAGAVITAADTLFILVFGIYRFRHLEFIVGSLAFLVAAIFAYELAVVQPVWIDVLKGYIPDPQIIQNTGILYTAIGILGATVMPHSLFLHSSTIQTRAYPRTKDGKKSVIRFGTWDSSLSLLLAFFVNSSILIVSSAAFYYGPNPNRDVANITDAYKLLAPALGGQAAKILFGVGLLATGQNSTIVGTLAGQIVMEGFVKIRVKPWIRRAITRTLSIIPVTIVAAVEGNAGAGKLLVMSQVILSLTLSFAVIPLVHFTSSTAKMGPSFVNGTITKIAACISALIIATLNLYLIYRSIETNQFGDS